MTIKNIVLGIAIIILTISVVVYGINTVYSEPEYSDFCNEFLGKNAEIIGDQKDCEGIGGKWNDYENEVRCVTAPCPQGYCDRDYNCRLEYEAESETYSKTLFSITLPLGIIIIALGALIFGLEAVGAGLMGGGVGCYALGYWRILEI